MIFLGPRTQPSKVDDDGLVTPVTRAPFVPLSRRRATNAPQSGLQTFSDRAMVDPAIRLRISLQKSTTGVSGMTFSNKTQNGTGWVATYHASNSANASDGLVSSLSLWFPST